MATVETGDAAGGGLLIWVRAPAATRDEMEEWYLTEHLPERLGVPGFRIGWRWTSLDEPERMLTIYETDRPQVLFGEDYLARVGDPTPWTQRVMGEGLQTDLVRTACRVAAREGAIRGAFVVSARFVGAAPELPPAVEGAAPGMLRRRWVAAEGAPEASAEAKLRGGDGSIGGALVADAKTAAEARATVADWRGRFPEAIVEGFRFLCLLDRRDLPG